MNTLSYKGYIGSVALVSGVGVKSCTCSRWKSRPLVMTADEGIEPDKSYTGALNVRISPATHRRAAMLARMSGVTLNAYIKDALEQKIGHAAVL